MSQPGAIENMLIQASLTGLGSSARMRLALSPQAVADQIIPFRSSFRPYNSLKPRIARRGLSLTSLDGGLSGDPDLESLREINTQRGTHYVESDFLTPTPVGCLPVWDDLRRAFPVWGRSHLLEFAAGGFFPPHRDLDGGCFRLFSPLLNARREDYAFLIDGVNYWYEPGSVVFINTRLEHSLFSFTDGFLCAVWNIPASKENYVALLQNLSVR